MGCRYLPQPFKQSDRSLDHRTVRSPMGQTQVEFNESIERTPPPTVSNLVVRVTASQNGQNVIKNVVFFVDSPGVHFLSRYSGPTWTSESVLKFVPRDSFTSQHTIQ